MPLEALYLRGPGGPHSGEAGPEPVRMAVPTPESPLSPVCSAGASVCPARGEGRRARPGTRAGSQAPPAWLTPQPRAPGLCRPRPAGAEAHLGIQVANNRDELRNDKQQRLVLRGIPEPLSTCTCPCRPPGSPGHTLLSSARREEDEPGPGARRAREPPPPPPTGPAGGLGSPRARRRAHGEENSLALSESRGLRSSVRAALGSWLSDFCHFCCCHKNKPYIIAAPQNARTAGSFVEVHGLLTCGVATGPRPDRREEG